MPKTRLSALFYLLLVFASGIAVGIVSYRLYATNTASANSPRTISEFRKRYLTGLREKVGASEAQITQITGLLDDTKAKLDALQAQEKPLHDRVQQEHTDAIRALLNDQQKIAFDQWRAERARLRAGSKSPSGK